jgi:hypothetical protein
MEILTLFLLYILSQKPDFPDRIQPIMSSLKNSEEMLRFMKDLSAFSDLFSKKKTEKGEEKREKEPEKNHPQNPVSEIADDFIQNCLKHYLKQ